MVNISRKIAKGDLVHVMHRGARGLPIVQDDADRWDFLNLLYYFNDKNLPASWRKTVSQYAKDGVPMFTRSSQWKPREPFVDVLAFCLMSNHFHLLLLEREVGGIAEFVKRVAGSMTKRFNVKYDGMGSIFQGKYTSRKIEEDEESQSIDMYINVKNPMELYSGGLKGALKKYDDAFEFAALYPFCSLADHVGRRRSPIISFDTLYRLFEVPSEEDYKEAARNYIEYQSHRKPSRRSR